MNGTSPYYLRHFIVRFAVFYTMKRINSFCL